MQVWVRPLTQKQMRKLRCFEIVANISLTLPLFLYFPTNIYVTLLLFLRKKVFFRLDRVKQSCESGSGKIMRIRINNIDETDLFVTVRFTKLHGERYREKEKKFKIMFHENYCIRGQKWYQSKVPYLGMFSAGSFSNFKSGHF